MTRTMPFPGIMPATVALPQYEMRARHHGRDDAEIEIWEVPSPATPHIDAPVRVAGLRGRNLNLIEHRVIKRLAQAGISIAGLEREGRFTSPLGEDVALNLGLVFRVLAPMRNRDHMRACIEGVEAMGREEAAYWLGMAMHRKNPRRVLSALRVLLTDPAH